MLRNKVNFWQTRSNTYSQRKCIISKDFFVINIQMFCVLKQKITVIMQVFNYFKILTYFWHGHQRPKWRGQRAQRTTSSLFKVSAQTVDLIPMLRNTTIPPALTHFPHQLSLSFQWTLDPLSLHLFSLCVMYIKPTPPPCISIGSLFFRL